MYAKILIVIEINFISIFDIYGSMSCVIRMLYVKHMKSYFLRLLPHHRIGITYWFMFINSTMCNVHGCFFNILISKKKCVVNCTFKNHLCISTILQNAVFNCVNLNEKKFHMKFSMFMHSLVIYYKYCYKRNVFPAVVVWWCFTWTWLG